VIRAAAGGRGVPRSYLRRPGPAVPAVWPVAARLFARLLQRAEELDEILLLGP